jgi:hypothetical protein
MVIEELEIIKEIGKKEAGDRRQETEVRRQKTE